MSFVGPRPALFNQYDLIKLRTKAKVHFLLPGLTGWAQVNGYRGETSDIFMMKKRVELDIWYIENWTPWLDIKVIIITVYSMIKGDMIAY